VNYFAEDMCITKRCTANDVLNPATDACEECEQWQMVSKNKCYDICAED
jgi:hypothetical protein